jgi:LysM repeat protein
MKSSSRQRRVRSLKAKAGTAHPDAELDNYGAEPNMKLSHAFMVVLALHVVAVGGLFAFNKVKAGHSKTSEKLQTEVVTVQKEVAAEESKSLAAAPIHEVVKEVKKELAPIIEAPETLSKHKEKIAPIVAKKLASVPLAPASTSTSAATRAAFLATKAEAPPISATPSASSSAALATVATMASSKTATAAAQSETMDSGSSIASIEYTILKGDNPYKIAKRFHVPYNQLIKLNDISDPRKMQIGQKIKIPKKS